jgi:ADP-ribosylglycohydrolase
VLTDNVLPDSSLLAYEIAQSSDEGRAVGDHARRADGVAALPRGVERERAAAALLDDLESLPGCPDLAAREPSDLDGIRASRPDGGRIDLPAFAGAAAAGFPDRVHGAWLGRCCGCLLGIPIESWRRDRMVGFLKDTGNWPISRYLSSDVGDDIRARYGVSDRGWNYGTSRVNWINNVPHMVEDDDLNYPVVALRVLESRGDAFTSADVAEAWLTDLPILHTFTAERIAYRNVANGIFPPESARRRNPCREWIGAQIRADVYGYANPGRPEAAAAMAFRDAEVSHVRNGIYGSLFVAAMLAAAAVTGDPAAIIRAGLSQIPADCRYAEGIRMVMAWCREGVGWEAAIDRLHARYDETREHHWCHAVPNGMAVCIGLLWGGRDLGATIGIAVAASFDKDCNGATAGSVVGMALGASRLPAAWTAPLGDTLEAGIPGLGQMSIGGLAQRTAAVAARRAGTGT